MCGVCGTCGVCDVSVCGCVARVCVGVSVCGVVCVYMRACVCVCVCACVCEMCGVGLCIQASHMTIHEQQVRMFHLQDSPADQTNLAPQVPQDYPIKQ